MHKIAKPVLPCDRILDGGHVFICDDFRTFIQGTFYLLDDIVDHIAVAQDAPPVDMAANEYDLVNA